MEEEKRPEWGNVQQNQETKNNFIIKYIIFVIILVLITVTGIYFTIKQIDKSMNDVSEQTDLTIENNEEVEETKKVAEDSKYAINSYSETYNTNSIKIRKYNDIDGEVIEENQETIHSIGANPQDFNYNIGFIQIDGLKDKVIQNKINAKLKNVPYTLEKEKYVWTNVSANFSNVLSVVITNDISYGDSIKTFNFDLTTGEEIPFEKLFVSSAPIKSMIASAMYEGFAWNELMENYEKYEGYLDMKNTDTSEVEDNIWLAVSKYNQIKDKIKYSFSPTTIGIHNKEIACSIDMSKYIGEIAIYKRYLTESEIFENVPTDKKDIIVFSTDITDIVDEATQISYGKISDNIFMEEVFFHWMETNTDDMAVVEDYIKNLSKEKQIILRQETPNNKGVIFQGSYDVWKNEKGYYCINVKYYKAECSKQYFDNEAFRDYIKVNARERADVGLNAFEVYMKEDYPEMQISEVENQTYFLSLTGEFLGNTEEEVENKLWE